jgi:hypothetical protein
MSDTTAGLMLEGAALEDARRVGGWAIFDAADCLSEAGAGSVVDRLELLIARARVGRLLGEPGDPSGQECPLASDDLTVLAEAAEQLADMSAAFAGDVDATPEIVAFWTARLDVLWRVLLLVDPLEWTS